MTAERGSNKLYGGYYKQAPGQTTGMYINEELLRYFKVNVRARRNERREH